MHKTIMINLFKNRLPKKGETVLHCNSEGCQGMDVFNWIGKVIEVEGDNVKVKIIKHNRSYRDCRDDKETEVETIVHPKGCSDLQKVDNIWILFR